MFRVCASVAAFLAAASMAAPARAELPAAPAQGWSDELRELFYFTPQGSRLMPNSWFRALETPDGGGRFADPAFLARYGFIPPDRPSTLNPDGYPIGFALDPGEPGSQFVGLTCAACHTAEVTVEGELLRIDGGPAHLDFDSFLADLALATTRTLFDPERFARFAARALSEPDEDAVAALKDRFTAFQVAMSGEAALRRPALASGPGRVDALTQIVNSLAVRDQSEVANLTPVAAPTSYPPLWLTPELEFVQWSPIAASPIGRNAGEVMGVFGTVNLAPGAEPRFATSALLTELHALETWVQELEAPAWNPDLMGAVDADLAAEGAALFSENCAACHNMPPYRRTDPTDNYFGKSFIEIGKVDYRAVGTDPAYVESLLFRLVKTNPVTAPTFRGAPIVPAGQFFLGTVGAAVGKAMDEAGLTDEERAALNGFRFRKGDDGKPAAYVPRSLADLKASPLQGVWATGPYLHNGSVPSVYDLLSPPEDRPAVFWTGGREIDREKLGFVSTDAPGRFRFDTALPGNGNGGHAYPPQGLTHDERMAILEYLKTQ